jgi:hypothetical protein
MKPMKFRVYIPEHDKVSYFELGDFDYSDRYLSQYEYPVQQFIGMHDINGKEIYEGDIVQYNNRSSWDGINLEVLWNEDNLAWEFHSKQNGVLSQSRLMKYTKDSKRFYDRVVVVESILNI